MVLRRGEGLRYERDYSFEKATWDFQAAPALSGLMAAFAVYLLWRMLNLISRIVGRRPKRPAPPETERGARAVRHRGSS